MELLVTEQLAVEQVFVVKHCFASKNVVELREVVEEKSYSVLEESHDVEEKSGGFP